MVVVQCSSNGCFARFLNWLFCNVLQVVFQSDMQIDISHSFVNVSFAKCL